MSRRMVAPGRWEDLGPAVPYVPRSIFGAVPLSAAVPLPRSPDIRQYVGTSPWHAIHRAEYNARRREAYAREHGTDAA